MYIHVCTPICTCTYTYISLYTHSVSSLHHLLETIGTSQLCSGNADGHFLTLPNIQKGVLKDMSSEFHCKLIHVATLLNQTYNYFSPGSKVVAVVNSTRKGYPSIYHVDCEFLVAGQVERCSACSRHRKSLRAMASRSSRDDHTHPSSHTPYAALSTPEKDERLHRLHLETKKAKLRLDRFRDKLELASTKSYVAVDETLDSDIRSMADECRDLVVDAHPKDSFQRIFWEQQEKAASLKDSRFMKWHPLCIKWCLYLRHLSGKAYEMLRNSKCIRLPSQRTLCDYTHYTTTSTGFLAEVDKQIHDAVDFTEERNRYTYCSCTQNTYVHVHVHV